MKGIQRSKIFVKVANCMCKASKTVKKQQLLQGQVNRTKGMNLNKSGTANGQNIFWDTIQASTR